MSLIKVLLICFWLFIIGCWIGNAIKLVSCDFKEPYKGEIIHTIGLFGPAACITVWSDDK